MDIKETEVSNILRLVAGILHIGRIKFRENGNYSQIADPRGKKFILHIKN